MRAVSAWHGREGKNDTIKAPLRGVEERSFGRKTVKGEVPVFARG
jgi:hypothetical protein